MLGHVRTSEQLEEVPVGTAVRTADGRLAEVRGMGSGRRALVGWAILAYCKDLGDADGVFPMTVLAPVGVR